jgi:hypothetical protein
VKFSVLRSCINILEERSVLCGLPIFESNVSLLKYQRGANAPLEEKVRVEFDVEDYDFVMEILPKRSDNNAE